MTKWRFDRGLSGSFAEVRHLLKHPPARKKPEQTQQEEPQQPPEVVDNE